jgi:membrane-bound ClpP family serine protease
MSWLLAQASGAAPVAASAGGDGGETYLLFGFLLLGIALVLLFIELFVPSGGLIGVLAGVASIGSIVAFFKYDTTWGVVASASYVILGPIIGVFAFKLWLNSPLAKGMILGGTDPANLDLDEDSAMSAQHARQERLAQLRQLVGAQGAAVTPLRPVGTVRINGQRIDAMAESGVIDAGTPIVVTDVYDNQIKVRAL